LIGFGRRTVDRALKLGPLSSRIVDGRPCIEENDALLFRSKILDLARAEGFVKAGDRGDDK
jgi:hypothetical protein